MNKLTVASHAHSVKLIKFTTFFFFTDMKTIEVRLHIQANYTITNQNIWDINYIIPNKDLEVSVDTDDLLENEDIKGCESHFRKDNNNLHMNTFFDFETNVSDGDYRDIKAGKFV